MVGLKYSLADMAKTLDYLALKPGKFAVIDSADHLFLSLLMRGCEGTVSGVAGGDPEPFVAVYRAFKEGDHPRTMASQAIGVRIARVLKSSSNLAYHKEALQQRGIDAHHMRKPHLDLADKERSQLARALEEVEREFPSSG